MTPAGPEIVHVCMPVSDVVIHDTWRVSGLYGTGSNDFSTTDIFVPEQRIFALLNPENHRSRTAVPDATSGLYIFEEVSVSLGIARRALDDLTELAQAKVPSLYSDVLADKAITQVELARRLRWAVRVHSYTKRRKICGKR